MYSIVGHTPDMGPLQSWILGKLGEQLESWHVCVCVLKFKLNFAALVNAMTLGTDKA